MPDVSATEGYVLAIDFGLKHIGVAVGQTITRTASGLATLHATNGSPDWEELQRLIAAYRPICIAVGLPLNMDDTESEMTEQARRFGLKLAELAKDTKVEFVDERLTSRAAKEALREQGNALADNHELAAVMIAESWLTGGS